MIDNMIFAFLLTLFAGLATAIGGFISLFVKNKNTTFLSVALGFSAGVMLYVSFVEIFVKANDSLTVVVGESLAPWLTVGGFFLGMFVIGIIDKILSKNKLITVTSVEDDKKKLFKLGIFTAVAISIHNFPEGLATFMATLEDPSLGIAIAFAIAIHNIPEGCNNYALFY